MIQCWLSARSPSKKNACDQQPGRPGGIQAAFRAQNELVGQGGASGKADAAGFGVASKELAVRQILHQHRLRLILKPIGVVSGLSAHLRACCSIMATTS